MDDQKKSKTYDPTDIWGWVEDDMKSFQEKGGQWATIAENYAEFMHYLDRDPAVSELAINQALDTAKELSEIKWELHLRHWRLQLWLRQRMAGQALPEAIDLLPLSLDPQVRDVPQRICAYHDVVDCFVEIDPVGYHQEIVENGENILAQLPERHCCATCVRGHLSYTFAATGNVQEAERYVKQKQALLNEQKRPETIRSYGEAYALLGKLDEAEHYYQDAWQLARERKDALQILKSVLPMADIYLRKGELNTAARLIHQARQMSKYHGNNAQFADLLALEGRLARATKRAAVAIDYLTRAAQLYFDLGCYRDAATAALEAAELAQTAEQTADEALSLAAQVVGQMPSTSKDMYQRLRVLGREPVTSVQQREQDTARTSMQQQNQKELTTLQEMLQTHMANKHFDQIVVTLYRIGRWHGMQQEHRAALDYIVASAALERLLKVSIDEREDTLNSLKSLKQNLPANTVESALSALAEQAPIWLQPLLGNVSAAQWRWVIQALSAEIDDKPVVEPEPEDREDNNASFQSGLDYVASQTALIVRNYAQIDPAELQPWHAYLKRFLEQTEQHLQQAESEAKDEATIEFGKAIISLTQGLIALASGESVENVLPPVLPPFKQIIEQVGHVAQHPVWQHPGSSPLDFLVEQAAQKAVEALRNQDEWRTERLARLALRYKLMNMDIKKEESLQEIARFLDELQKLVLADGKTLPVAEPPLQPPFAAILKAVFEAGAAADSQGDSV